MSQPITSIDDLLGAAEEVPSRPRRPRGHARWWVRTVLVAAAGTAVIVFGLRLFGTGVSAPVVFAGLFALQALARVTRQVAPPPDDRGPTAPVWPGQDAEERDALRSSVNRWETRLAWSKGDRERFARITWPAIGEIADERLRLRHGVTRASDPQRARALLGEATWAFLSTPPKRTPAPRDLAAIVAELEKI